MNYIDLPDPPFSRQTSTINYFRSLSETSNKESIHSDESSCLQHESVNAFITRNTAHLWISLRDLYHKSVHIDRILKQPGILSKLTHIEGWVQSCHESLNEALPKTNVDLPLELIKARARTLIWDILEMKNEILYPHPGIFLKFEIHLK